MRKPRLLLVVGVIAAVPVLTTAVHAANPWIKLGGPLGGLGYDVRISPTDKKVMFVTDNFAGVNRSTNGGATWASSNTGITIRAGNSHDAIPIFSLTVDPNNPQRVWAGTAGEGSQFGVFRSDDGGLTWVPRVTGIDLNGALNLTFRGFTVRPGNSDVVFAQCGVSTGLQGREFERQQGRIYKTTNGGGAWTLVWSGDSLARYVIVHPTDPNTLYASTGFFDREAYNHDCSSGVPGGGVGVLKSTNGGASWSQTNSGLTDLYVGSLRMHPQNPNVLLAGTGNNACSRLANNSVVSGVFRTEDGGASWTKVVVNDIINGVVFSPSNPDIAYAGSFSAIYRSTDAGRTWIIRQGGAAGAFVWGPQGVRAGFPIDLTLDPAFPDVVYANNYGGGVFRSVSGGSSWDDWSQGYSGAELDRVAVSGADARQVYAVGRSGPFRSRDAGASWTGIATGDAASSPTSGWAVAVRPDNADTVLISDEHQGKLYYSSDAGNHFQRAFTHPAADPSNKQTRQGFRALAYAPANSSIAYAGLSQERVFFDQFTAPDPVIVKSTDGGVTWKGLTSNLHALNVTRFAVHPQMSDLVYATTSKGLYITNDGGTTWVSASSLGGRRLLALAMDPSDPTMLYAGESPGGVWKTTDAGTTWSGPHNTGFASGAPGIEALAIDPQDSDVVYAADISSGVYRSTNGGQTWAAFPDATMTGLSTRAVVDLAFSAHASQLYAASRGGGMFRYNFCGNGVADPSGVECGLTPPCQADSDCDDGNECTIDMCDPVNSAADLRGCVSSAMPRTGCRAPTQPQRAVLQIKDNGNDKKHHLNWNWSAGEATLTSDFGDPVNGSTRYSICVFDRAGGATTLALSATVPPGEQCGKRLCWSPIGSKGFRYNNNAAPDGVSKILLQAGGAGAVKIVVEGKGAKLSVPALPLAQSPSVEVQLVNSDGLCWLADYSAPATRNSGSLFKDKSD
jgi:photosystem II stability/assembly factor-like uncharacterized protein